MTGGEGTASKGSGATSVRRHRNVALWCAAGAASMLGLAFAAVPLYQLYCQATGFAGTTQRAAKAPDRVLERTVRVHFDANMASGLPWTFEPVERTRTVRLGESALAFYRATNTSDRSVTGSAVFNVTPEAAGLHFNKIECFCFKEQTLAPGESVEMPVSFFVDAELATDPDSEAIIDITLSYTFYPVVKPTAGLDGSAIAGGSRKDGG